MDQIIIRSLTIEDLPFATKLMHSQKWFSQTQQELKFALSDPACRFLLAEKNGDKCGLVMSRVAGAHATIANLIVSSDHRRQGIGKVLFKSAMDQLLSMNVKMIVLSAAEKWISFFEGFGFKKHERVIPLFGEIPPKPHPQVSQLRTTDMEDINQLDIAYYQGDRRFFMTHYLQIYPNLALKFTKDNRITSYMYGQVGLGGLIFAGPMVTNSNHYHEARALLQHFQDIIGYQPIQLSTTKNQTKWIWNLIELGMKPNPEIIYRMVWGFDQRASNQEYLLLRGSELIA